MNMPEKSDMSAGLGTLIELPAEIRELVWLHALSLVKRWTNDPGQRGSILTVSRQVYAEVRPILYHGRSLKIRIAPPGAAWTHWPSEFGITDQHGLPVAIWNPYFSFSNLMAFDAPGAMTYPAGIWRIPFNTFGPLRIEVEPPHVDDPGEVIQSWNKLCFLVRVFNILWIWGLSSRLPPLEIYFLGTEGRRWSTDGKLNKSIQASSGSREQSDLELLLLPLHRLRHVPSLTIDTSGIPLDSRCRSSLETIHSVATAEGPLSRDESEENEKTLATWLGVVLDDLPGYTASMLRIERLASWDEGFEAALCRRAKESLLTTPQFVAALVTGARVRTRRLLIRS